MTDTRYPTPDPPEGDSGLEAGVCPTPEELAAYAAGGSSAAERARVEEHASGCEDCHFILRETGIFEGEQATLTTKPARRPLRTYFLSLAATLILALGSAALWKRAHPVETYARSIQPLVEAVGSRRFIEARLTGGFRFGPLIGRKRGAGPALADTEHWALFSAAEKIRSAGTQRPSADARRALAATHLVLGETGLAVEQLERLARDIPRDAGLLNDLAAAYLTRAQEGRDDDYARAFESASKAVEIDPKLAEGWFNRALAADALALAQEADTSRRHVRELEGGSAWSGAIGEDKGSSLEPPAAVKQELLTASLPSAVARVPRALAETRDVISLDLLARAEPADLERADALAQAYLTATGDATLRDDVRALAHPEPAARARLVAAHRTFADARAALDRGDSDHARQLFERAARDLGVNGSAWGRFYLAVIAYQAGQTDAARAEFIRIASSAPAVVLAARCHWMEALIHAGRGESQAALQEYRKAQELFLSANDRANVASVEYLLADAYRIVGAYVEAWRHQRKALLDLGFVSDPVRRHMTFQSAVTIAMENNLPRAAQAFNQRALAEDKSSNNSLTLAEDHIAAAWIAAQLEPSAVRRSFAEADRLLQASSPGGMRERLEAELAWKRGQLVNVLAMDAIADLGRSIEFFSTRGFGARLPVLYGVRGRALARAGRAAEADADLHAGLQALASARERREQWPRTTMSERSWRVVDDLVGLQLEIGRSPESTLVLIERERAAARGDEPELTVEALHSWAARLPPHDAILFYYCAGPRIYAWTLRRSGTRAAQVPLTTSAVEDLVADFSNLVVEGRLDGFDALSDRLHAALLGPVETWLDGVEHLTVVPDGPVARLAFAALHRATKLYAGERWTLDVAPELPLRTRAPRSGAARSLLALRGTGGAALGATHPESDAIAALYGDVARLDGSAGRDAVVRALLAAEVVHFAGHATLNPVRPDLSGLWLADTTSGDADILDLEAISRLDLRRLRLVTLASCDAAGGVALRSVGPVTIAGAFLRAGAETVIAPVGPIDDRFARRVFVELHRRYLETGDAQGALQAIQRELLAKGDRSEAVQSLNLVAMRL